MELIRINDVVETFGISSRTLRYYEQAGILWSAHPDNKSQRYYDSDALERLKQIIVLRKLQIPIKDIAKIYKDENTASLIQAFVDKLDSLDREIASLSDLRKIVDEFLHKMLMMGIKKISAITLLYEETERRLSPVEIKTSVTYEELTRVSREALKLHDVRIIELPPMHMLTSQLKSSKMNDLNADNMQNMFSDYGLMPSPGLRNCFYLKKPDDQWLMLIKIPDEFVNTTPYVDEQFEGGLYAIASSFMEDMDETFILLRKFITENEYFELDTDKNNNLRRIEMIEEILPWNIANQLNRYQQDVYIPIRIKPDKIVEN